jgi:hypothetical protein
VLVSFPFLVVQQHEQTRGSAGSDRPTQTRNSPTFVFQLSHRNKKQQLGHVRFDLSATSQQYFSLRTNRPPATSQQYFSLTTNQHQPSATSQTNTLLASSVFRSRDGPSLLSRCKRGGDPRSCILQDNNHDGCRKPRLTGSVCRTRCELFDDSLHRTLKNHDSCSRVC